MVAVAIVFLYMTIALTSLWVYQICNRKRKRRPPGPFQLPLLGNILQIYQADSKYSYRALQRLSKKYGDVMTVKVGLVNAVVICGYESIKKVLNRDDFLDHLDSDWFLHKSFNKRIGLFSATTEIWKPTRRFVLHKLRDFGYGKKLFLQNILESEMDELTRTLDLAIEKNKGIVEPNTLFRIPSINIVWASAAGTRFDHKDPKITKLMDLVADWAHNAKFMEGAGAAYPFLIKWFPNLFSIKKLFMIDDEMHGFLKELVDDIRERGTYKREPGSFIEAFLQHMELDNITSPEDREAFSEKALISTLYDLFIAGSSSTSSTLDFALMWLTMYPEVQERLRKEIEDVIGGEHLPTLNDRPKFRLLHSLTLSLPYVRALILEIHRLSHIVPVMPRKVYKDTPLDSYIIPGNSMVLVNLYSVLMDEGFWGDPQNFRPSRFLDEKNNIINDDRVINFAAGKRNCIGIIIAESAIFTVLTHLVQRYDLLPAENGQIFDTDPIVGAALSVRDYEIKVRRRV